MFKTMNSRSVFLFVVTVTAFIIICITSVTHATSASHRRDEDYFFYHVDGGMEENVESLIRLRRQAGTGSSPAAVETSSSASSSTTLPPTSQETTLSSVDGDARGWTGPSQLDEHLLEKIDIPDREINDTLKSGAKKEGGNVTMDNTNKYYSTTFVPYEHTWVDLDLLNATGRANVQEHKMLSKSYRRAATIKLNFKFPFYGHPVDNITIATGGFLYTGDYVHSWLAATQYIAPLMANFDTSQDDEAKIRYADNGTALIVEWKNVYLQTQNPSHKKVLEGPFTFQAVLHSNGDIFFAYKELPIKITNIAHEEHPVKVGLSDAYIIDRTIFFVRRKTIYEYHRVNMKEHDITNSTAIYLKALPTCNLLDTCDKCLGAVDDDNNSLGCQWCPRISGCSDGMDRNRQRWLMSSCDSKKQHLTASEIRQCEQANTRTFSDDRNNNDHRDITFPHEDITREEDGQDDDDDGNGDNPEEDESEVTQKKLTNKKGQYHHIGIATISIVLTLVLSICAWFIYAYFFPHTWSGQLLIKYRPSRWHWRRGEPRYTAASIHM